MQIIGGSSCIALAQQIALRLGKPFVAARTQRFPDQELKVHLDEPIHADNVVIIQSTSRPANDHLVELFLLVDTIKQTQCKHLTAVMPYFGYGRHNSSSKPTPQDSHFIARLLKSSGVDKIITIDRHDHTHDDSANAFIQNLDPTNLFATALPHHTPQLIISPDQGAFIRGRSLAQRLKAEHIVFTKHRQLDGRCIMSPLSKRQVDTKHCIIVDDIVDTGETLYRASCTLRHSGARSVVACVTHGVFSKGCIHRMTGAGFDRVFVTDTISHTPRAPFIHLISVDKIIADTLQNNNQ